MEGHIQATGVSYVPTQAYVWVNLTKIKLDDTAETSAVSNDPVGRVADSSGNDSNVSGGGNLHIMPKTVMAKKSVFKFLSSFN